MRYAEIVCVYVLPATCILASGTSRGTSRLALWRIGVGRNPAGLFDVEMCEQMTVSAPTRQAMGLRHSSIVYTNAHVLEWEPDFRLVSGAAKSLSRGGADSARVNTLSVAACSTIVLLWKASLPALSH